MKLLKRAFFLLLCTSLIFSAIACNGDDGNDDGKGKGDDDGEEQQGGEEGEGGGGMREPKYVSFIGDSISTYDGWSNNANHNSTIGNNAIFYSTTNPFKPGANFPVMFTWWHKVAHSDGFLYCVNNSISGSGVTKEETYRRCAPNLHNTTTGQTPDIVIIYKGINDWAWSVPLGTFTGTVVDTPETFSHAYAYTIKQILLAYPGVEVYCCTLLPEMTRGNNGVNNGGVSITEFNAAIENVAEKMGATVIDLYNESGITFENLSQYTLDTLHPNEEGMQLIADTVLSVLYDNN